MTPAFLCALAADPGPENFGRIEHTMMNDQALLELLVAHCTGTAKFKDSSGNYLDIAEWHGVRINSKKDVDRICWSLIEVPFFGPGGSMDLGWMPATVITFVVKGNDLRGTIDTAALPRKLVSLNLSHNRFHGVFEVARLPADIKEVYILKNELSGPLNLAALPSGMGVLNVGENQFTGTLDLTSLPATMIALWLHDNYFEGTIDLAQLPERLRSLALENNNLRQQTVRIARTAIESCTIDLQGNRIQEALDAEGNGFNWTGSIRLAPLRNGINAK